MKLPVAFIVPNSSISSFYVDNKNKRKQPKALGKNLKRTKQPLEKMIFYLLVRKPRNLLVAEGLI